MTQPSLKARWSVEVDRDLNRRLDEVIPWGLKSEVFRRLVILLVESIERDGKIVLGAVLAGDVRLQIKESVRESIGRSDEGHQGDDG